MNIALIGSGHAALALGRAMKKAGHRIVCVYSRRKEHARQAARVLRCSHAGLAGKVNPQADVVLVAVSDVAVASVMKKIKPGRALVLHTAGSVPLAVFRDRFAHCGVLYPVQTLQRDKPVSFSDIPLCIEYGNAASRKTLLRLARSLSRRVYELDSEQRAVVHLAAVFANNFSNRLVAIADELLASNRLDPALIRPLLRETFARLEHGDPRAVQTGPAKRGDRRIIRQHLARLNAHPAWRKIYALLTREIMNGKQTARQ